MRKAYMHEIKNTLTNRKNNVNLAYNSPTTAVRIESNGTGTRDRKAGAAQNIVPN